MAPASVAEALSAGEPPLLLDVREPWEWTVSNLEDRGAVLIPLGELEERMEELDPGAPGGGLLPERPAEPHRRPPPPGRGLGVGGEPGGWDPGVGSGRGAGDAGGMTAGTRTIAAGPGWFGRGLNAYTSTLRPRARRRGRRRPSAPPLPLA